MTDEPVEQLTNRRLSRITAWIGIVVALAVVAVVISILLGDSGDRPPTANEKRVLADETCPRVKTSHFYRIEKAGKTSYVLGTRHAGVALAKYPGSVRDAFRAATVAVFESDLLTSDPPRDENVEAELGPKLWAHYRKLVGDEVANRVKRRGVGTAVAELVLLYEDPSQSIDLELQRLARDSRKQIVALEDEDETAHLAESYIGIDALRTALRQVSNRKTLERVVRRSLRAYCEGGDSGLGDPEYNITNARTQKWAAKLVPMLEQGGVFVAVGSAHVDDGTLDLGTLLEKHGFTVSAVR